MSVLETFYILFKSDADKAAQGLDKVDDAADRAESSLNKADKATKATAASAGKAAAATGNLAAATAVADANAKRLAASFLTVAKAAAAPLLGLLSVSGIANIATGRAENIRELDQFSAKLNSTISDVDAFQRSVQELGGEGSKALDSLVKIGEKVNEAFADSESGARKDFEAWGLSFKDAEGNALGAVDAMLALATSIEGVSRAEGLARIKKLGIEDAATIEFLMRGRGDIEDYIQSQKDLGVVTEEQADIVRDYYQALGTLGNQLTSIGNVIAATVLPGLTNLLRGLTDLVTWATENQHLVEGFFIGVSSALTIWLLPAMWKLAAATLAALWPWALLAAAVIATGIAFGLAYEDFKAWADGQPSILGDLLGDYETFMEGLQGLFDAFSWDNFLLDLANIKQWFSDAFSIDNFMKDVEAIKAAFTGLGDWVKQTLGAAVQGVLDLIAGIPGAIKAAIVAIPSAVAVGAGGGVVQPAAPYTGGNNPAAAADYIRNGQWALQGAANAPQGLAAPGTTNNTSTVNVGTVTVNTQATDADGMAAAAKAALERELSNTAAGFDDGVDR